MAAQVAMTKVDVGLLPHTPIVADVEGDIPFVLCC